MSGWDVSSTPTWGPEDGPDETQAFSASGDGARDYGQDFGAPGFGGGYSGDSMAGGPPPEFFGQEQGPGGYPQRTPGQSFQDLPRRESPRGRRADGYGQDNGYGQSGTPGQDWRGGGAEEQTVNWGPGGQDASYGGQDAGFGQDAAFGQDWAASGQNDDGWGRTAGRSAAPWDDRQQDVGFNEADGGFGRQQGGLDYSGQDYASQDYASQDFQGQQGRGGQAPMEFGRQERDSAARNDPALSDFFAGQGQGQGWSGGERSRRTGENADWTGRQMARPAADDDVDWTGRPKRRPAADQDVDWTGRPVGDRRPSRDRDDDDEGRGGLGIKAIVAIGAVVVVVIAAGAYLLLGHKGGGTPTASGTSTSGATAPAAPSASGKATATGAGTAATAAFTLSTPNTADGFPIGQDPADLTNAKATATTIIGAVSAGGGGTVKGNPVSAAYTLPAEQVITFVGYQGTFTPAKVATILAKLGTDPNTYPAGPNGGDLGCANTTTAPDGAVCVWSTSSTLGITEFYTATGPETLNSAQSKGASDTTGLRADVEKKS